MEGAEEMAQQLGVCLILTDDLLLTTAYNSRSRGFKTIFSGTALRYTHICKHNTHAHTHAQMHTLKQ